MMNTTWSMSDGSPGRSGTARAVTPRRGARSAGAAAPPSVRSVRRLFCATAVEYADNSASLGTAMTLTEPRYEWTYRPCSPERRPTPDPTPNNVPTASVLASALTSIAVGYQPVGMRPRKLPQIG